MVDDFGRHSRFPAAEPHRLVAKATGKKKPATFFTIKKELRLELLADPTPELFGRLVFGIIDGQFRAEGGMQRGRRATEAAFPVHRQEQGSGLSRYAADHELVTVGRGPAFFTPVGLTEDGKSSILIYFLASRIDVVRTARPSPCRFFVFLERYPVRQPNRSQDRRHRPHSFFLVPTCSIQNRYASLACCLPCFCLSRPWPLPAPIPTPQKILFSPCRRKPC